jgi:hypothetical protein
LLPFLPSAAVCSVENAEVLCLGIILVAVFMLVLPLSKATANSAFMKCHGFIYSNTAFSRHIVINIL